MSFLKPSKTGHKHMGTVLSASHELCTFDTVGGEESDVSGFQRVVVGEVWSTSLGLGFTCQRGVVHLKDENKN